MFFDLTGKTALVTGASRGLGKEIAKTLAKANAHVILTSRSEDKLNEVKAEIEADGGAATVIPADFSKIDNIKQLYAEIREKFARLNIVVNNAGVTVAKNAFDITPEDWHYVMDTNVTGLFFSCQEAGKMMRDQENSRIINIASILGTVADYEISPYVTSKGAVIQLTKALALEWSRYGITVNAVGPGYVKTDINREALETNEKFYNHVLRKIPMRHLGEPEDIAAAVLYLSSDEAKYVTGHTLFVDGGWLIQ